VTESLDSGMEIGELKTWIVRGHQRREKFFGNFGKMSHGPFGFVCRRQKWKKKIQYFGDQKIQRNPPPN